DMSTSPQKRHPPPARQPSLPPQTNGTTPPLHCDSIGERIDVVTDRASTNKNPYTNSYPNSSSNPNIPHRPVNRALETAKSHLQQEHPLPIPHAPNRNLINPTTRVSTPNDSPYRSVPRETPTKTFRRPTMDEELRTMKKRFFGTTTLDAYDVGMKLGEGTFGVVTKGIEIATNRAIALKKLITHNLRDGVSVTTVREIKILKSLDHPNIVPIIDMVVERKVPGDRSNRGDVFMVFPYLDHDLCGLLMNHDFKITHSIAKLFMKQILEGMAYIHANNFIHRDIKSANILVDKNGLVMIADFGLARSWSNDSYLPRHLANEYTNMVVTRWYRAPELLLGDVHYGPAVDMWSVGYVNHYRLWVPRLISPRCVLGELYHRLPILPGESDRDQLSKIFSKCGPLTPQSFPGWESLPGFPDAKGFPWHETPASTSMLDSAHKWAMDRTGAELMCQLLTLDPKKRLTATEALKHPWFWVSPLPATLGSIPAVESSHEMTRRDKADSVVRNVSKQPPPGQNRNQAWGLPPPQQHQNQRPGPPPYGAPGRGPVPNGYGNPLPSYPPPQAMGYNSQSQHRPHMSNQHPPRQPVNTNFRPPVGGGMRAGVPVPPFSLTGPGHASLPPPPFALAANRRPGPPPGMMVGVKRPPESRDGGIEKRRRGDGVEGLPYE
ncbi:hypothetical protein P7C73_g6741, partial [Tremellales sp. Uapishka_1]